MVLIGHTSLTDVQEAIYTALTGNSAFTSLCNGPFDPAVTNQPFPYCAFGEHVETNWYQFQSLGKQVEFIIHIYSQQPTYAEAYRILDSINAVIEGQPLSLTSGNYTNVRVLFVDARKRDEPDGITRHIEGTWKTWNNAN